jgi:SAM-dependent methyltransferase
VRQLLNNSDLEQSSVVANSLMNRTRNLSGGDSYQKELGFDPVGFLRSSLAKHQNVAWLDLCCGAGRALLQAADRCKAEGISDRVSLQGVDLIPMFEPIPSDVRFLSFDRASVAEWETNQVFDLISCVHGLHYVGDKLGIIQKAARWLRAGGLLVAHLDYDNLRLSNSASARMRIGRDLHSAGFRFQSKRRLLTCCNPPGQPLPYRYLGADDSVGPNYTGQPAVTSYYERLRG